MRQSSVGLTYLFHYYYTNFFVKKILLYEQPETFGTMRKVENFKSNYFRKLDFNFKKKSMEIYNSQIRGHRNIQHLETSNIVFLNKT